MDNTLQKALYIILISLGLAFVFNFLFFGKLIGISVLIFVAVLLGAVFSFGRYQKISLRNTWWLFALIGFFALMPAIRANEFLNFLNICATFALLMLLAHQLVGTPAFLMRLRDYLVLAVIVPFRMLGRAFSTVSLLGQIHSRVENRDVWIRVLKGIIMALPILIIFGLLFSQADLAFSQFIKGFIDISIAERTAQYLALLVFAFVAGLCFLSYIFMPKPMQPVTPASQVEPIVKSGRGIEVLVFLGLIAALFLLFIGFQLAYLFGGEANIINAGFTYAEYARRGFWELLVVAFLSLVVLLATEKYAESESKRDKLFLLPALILIIEVGIVIISAFKRLSLYIDMYGMTALRFSVAVFIGLLLVLFILLAIKFIKSKQEQFFAFGAMLSVVIFLIIVNVVNPDAFIAKSNIERFDRTGKLDAFYVAQLSVDAESEKIQLYHKLNGDDKIIVEEWLRSNAENLQNNSTNWRSVNLSRVRAMQLLRKIGYTINN